jgi:D-arabinose 1-dehydrogenase-like Zn-dependent alcohol dehydrogenase
LRSDPRRGRILTAVPPIQSLHASDQCVRRAPHDLAPYIGGIAETQEMLDFCAEHDVSADVEMIAMEQIDEAYDRMLGGDVKFRFVIDMESMPAAV